MELLIKSEQQLVDNVGAILSISLSLPDIFNLELLSDPDTHSTIFDALNGLHNCGAL